MISGSSSTTSQITRRAASTSSTTTEQPPPPPQQQQQPAQSEQQQQQQQQQHEQQSQSQLPSSQSSSSTPSNRSPDPDPAAVAAFLPSLRKYPYTVRTGTVVSVGKMDRTVRVVHRHTVWDDHIRKYYSKQTTYLVADPRNSLREGDVIEFSSGYPKSRHVHHVVERIISPFGVPIDQRPPVMTREQREMERARKRLAKLQRREQRRLEEAAGNGDGSGSGSGNGEGVVFKEHVGRIKSLVLERVGEANKSGDNKEAQRI